MIGAKKTGPKNFKLNEISNVIENKVEQKTPLACNFEDKILEGKTMTLVGEILFSFVPPSNSIVSVSCVASGTTEIQGHGSGGM